MNTADVYTSKAEKYAKYRWDYAPQAITAVLQKTSLPPASHIADLGAGSGILTAHFTEHVEKIYAIEPNKAFCKILRQKFEANPKIDVIEAPAEATGLPSASVELITVAQAIHWFDPVPARQEMLRIIKAGGYLVLIKNYATGEIALQRALGSLMSEEYGADFTVEKERPAGKPTHFYYGHDNFQKLTFPFTFSQSWGKFIGALGTAAYMPDEDHPLYQKLKAKAKEIFDQYSQNGYWLGEGETELIIGQLVR